VEKDTIRRLGENVYFVPGEGNARWPACHGFLFRGKETVLIDAGMGEARIRDLDRNKRIDILIISHSHPDHIRSSHLLSDRYIMLPKETPNVVTDLLLLGERFMGSAEVGARWSRLVHDVCAVRPVREPDARFGDGDILEMGGAELEAIHAPGHLNDHYCFLERKTGTLMTVDIDLTSFGPWYGNPESDIEAFESSVRKVMSIPSRRICSSHRRPIEGRAARLFEAYLAALARHKRMVLDLCDPPSSLDEMTAASPFYGNGFPDRVIQQTFERQIIAKNLALLVREGIVEESGGLYRRVDR